MCGALLTLGKGNVDAAPGGEVGKITVIGTMMSGVGGNGQSAHNLAAGLRGLCLGEREVDGEGAGMANETTSVGGNGKMEGVAEMEGVLGWLHTLWERWRLKQLPQTSSCWVGWSMIYSRVIFGGISGMLGGWRHIN